MLEISAFEIFIHVLNFLIIAAVAVLVVLLIVRAVKRRKATFLETCNKTDSDKRSNMKMIFGGLMFFCGFLGVLAFTVAAAVDPVIYNDTTGIISTLTAMGAVFPYVIFCIMAAAGISICAFEAYGRK